MSREAEQAEVTFLSGDISASQTFSWVQAGSFGRGAHMKAGEKSSSPWQPLLWMLSRGGAGVGEEIEGIIILACRTWLQKE